MKAISLWQPWASLLAAGLKCVETRGWPTGHRGPLLIHAAKRWDPELAAIAAKAPFRPALERLGIVFTATEAACQAGWGLPFGAIVGRVNLVACYPTADVRFAEGGDVAAIPWGGGLQLPGSERVFGDFTSGRFAWLCGSAVRFAKPIPFRGQQSMFDIADELVSKAEAAPCPR